MSNYVVAAVCITAFIISHILFKMRVKFDDLTVLTLLIIVAVFSTCVCSMSVNPVQKCHVQIKEHLYPCDKNFNCSVFEISLNSSSLCANISSQCNENLLNSIKFQNCEYYKDCISYYKNSLPREFYCVAASNRDFKYTPNDIVKLVKKPVFNTIRNKMEISSNEFNSDCWTIFLLIIMFSCIFKFSFKINVYNEIIDDTNDNENSFSLPQNNHQEKRKMPENKSRHLPKKERECAICLQSVKYTEVYTPINCFCVFHGDCLDKRLNKKCPLCLQ